MEHLGSHWMDFLEISRLIIFLKNCPASLVSSWILLGMRNTKMHFIVNKIFWKSCHLWDNVEKCRAGHVTGDNITWYMHSACWMTKAKNTHLECVILIVFPWQHRFHKCASLLHYTYITCLVSLFVLYWSFDVLHAVPWSAPVKTNRQLILPCFL